MDSERLQRFVKRTSATLAFYEVNPALPRIDQISQLPKDVIYRLAFDGFVAELPHTASVFQECSSAGSSVTESGQMLQAFVRQTRGLAALPAHVFAEQFIRHHIPNALRRRVDANEVRFRLYYHSVLETNEPVASHLELIRALWLTDLRNRYSPTNANPFVLRRIDPLSLWAYCTRRHTHPLTQPFSTSGSFDPIRIATGYVYDLRSMAGFDPPVSDIRGVIRHLLYEAALLRIGSIPPRAVVEINFPPFVALEFQEFAPDFVTVEAIDRDRKCLPVYLFPMQLEWIVPNTGVGPGNGITTFKQMCQVVAMMAAAALRDFWVIEDRERTLGPPRISQN